MHHSIKTLLPGLVLAGCFFSICSLSAQVTNSPPTNATDIPAAPTTDAPVASNPDDVLAKDTAAIAASPYDASAYFKRAYVYMTQNNNDLALADLNKAIEISPNYEQAYYRRAFVYALMGKYDEAIADMTKDIELAPTTYRPYYRRAYFYMLKGDYVPAIRDLNQVIEMQPNMTAAYFRRSYAFMLKGDYPVAINGFSQLIQDKPNFQGAYNQLAWLLATCPQADMRDGKKAVAIATTACEMSNWKLSGPLDTLAAAYAESGDFDNALKYEAQAIANQNDPDVVTAQKERLALYESHKPYHIQKYDPKMTLLVAPLRSTSAGNNSAN